MFIDMVSRERQVADSAIRTALIVEDDPRLQKAIGKHLGRAGFRVLSALHYDAAVGYLAIRSPHLVCVDVSLPAKSGYELCEHIRGPLGLTRVPIIVMSEHGHSEDMAFAEAAGANAFLHKPFSRRQHRECVEALLFPTPGSAPPVHELARLATETATAEFGRKLTQAVQSKLAGPLRAPRLVPATPRAASAGAPFGAIEPVLVVPAVRPSRRERSLTW